MAISTNGTVLARLAGALYNTQMSNATYKEVAALDPSTLANVLYVRDFNMVSDASVATTLVTNLGLKAVAGLDNWVAAQLTAAGANKGAKVVDLLNSFAQMTADVTYGAAATAFNTKIDVSLALSQTTDNKGGTFEAAGVVSVTGATFALTSAIDTLTGTAAADTFNGDFSVSTQVSAADVINGGAGTDKFVVSGFTGAVAAGTTTVAAIAEQQQLVLTGAAAASTNTAFLGVNTIVTIADTAAVVAGLIVANKANIIAGTTAVAAGLTDISASGAVLTLTYGGAGGTGDVPNLAAVAASNGTTANASAELLKGVAGSSVATAATTQSVLPQLTSVEIVEFANAIGNSDINLASTTKAANGVEQFNFKDVSALNGKTITVSTGQAVQLATGNAAGATAGTVTVAYAATATNADLILNGYQTAGVEAAVTLTGGVATTVNVNSTGAGTKNEISTFTLPATTTKLVVTGDKALGITTNLISGATATTLKEVDASANTGGVTTKFGADTAATFKFTGGAGNDVVILPTNGLQALTAGSQINFGAGTADKIGLFDTAMTEGEYATLNTIVGADRIGLNAAVTFDASKANVKYYSLDTAAAQTISNMATGSTVAFPIANGSTIALAAAVGVNDATVILGAAATTGLTFSRIDAGQTNLSIQTLGAGGATANVITTFTNAPNSSIVVTGGQALTFTLASSTTIGSKVDASAATGIQTLTAGTATYGALSAMGDILIGGSAADVLKSGLNSGSLTGNGGNDTFSVAAAVAAGTTNGNITTITDFTKGDSILFHTTAGAFATTAINLSAATTEQAAIDLLVAGSNSDLKWGVYAGNTYIVDDVGAGATLATTDFIVKVVGTHSLSTSTLSGNTLTYA
jgi:hypothetical protein